MNKIQLDGATLTKLRSATEISEVCDAGGIVVGYFSPAVDRAWYENVEPPISQAELQQIESNLRGRPLADIVSELESRP